MFSKFCAKGNVWSHTYSQVSDEISNTAGSTVLVVLMTQKIASVHCKSGLILGLCPANERRRYFVTKSLIGWAQT